MLLADLREQVFTYAKRMAADGLARGSQGNISALDRASGLIAITPSAADYDTMTYEDIALIDVDGTVVEGRWKPTIETPLHTLLYRRKPDISAVMHCHAPHISGFAAALRPVPLVLAEAAACVGRPVPVAPFMPSGTASFAELMLDVIGDGNAAVMGQHGIVTCGVDLHRTYATTTAVEDSARAYLYARLLGVDPAPIPEETAMAMHEWWLKSYKRVAL